jgi:hypothetical protein
MGVMIARGCGGIKAMATAGHQMALGAVIVGAYVCPSGRKPGEHS